MTNAVGTFPDRLYHATPLHYVPHIVQAGALYAQSVLDSHGIASRATARRRDRMLGLHDYVHLSLKPQTPLLADKLHRGYPHALLVFAAAPVFGMPEVALLPGNAKSWRSRAALTPVTDPAERDALLRRHAATGRFPSVEALVKYGLALTFLERIAFLSEDEHRLVTDMLTALGLDAPAALETNSTLFPPCPGYRPMTGDVIAAYFSICRAAGRLLPPPLIPFD